MESEKEPEVNKKKTEMSNFFIAYSCYFSASIHRVISRPKQYVNLSWLGVRISHHRFNNSSELLNRYIAAKIRRGIFSKDLMGRKYNCSLPSKVTGKCVYKGKFRSKYLIYEVKCSMCNAIYIGNTQQTQK